MEPIFLRTQSPSYLKRFQDAKPYRVSRLSSILKTSIKTKTKGRAIRRQTRCAFAYCKFDSGRAEIQSLAEELRNQLKRVISGKYSIAEND